MTISLSASPEEDTMSIYESIESNDSRRHLKLRSPVTMEVTGELICANTDDVANAIARARAAQPSWAATPIKDRAAVVERALKIVIERQDEIIDTVVKEPGKARSDAMSMEVFSVADQQIQSPSDSHTSAPYSRTDLTSPHTKS